MKLLSIILLAIFLIPLVNATCTTGETKCNNGKLDLCFKGFWVEHKNCEGCDDSIGYATCFNERYAGCCLRSTIIPVASCIKSVEGGCGWFHSPEARSCYQIDSCTEHSDLHPKVETRLARGNSYQITIWATGGQMVVFLRNGINTFEIPFRAMEKFSYALTPQLDGGVYSLEIFNGLKRIYSGTLDTGFNANTLMSNQEFLDVNSVTEQEIQTLFETNKWWVRNYRLPSGVLISKKIFSEAQKQQINPLLILARIQTEQSAIQQRPTKQDALNNLTGCQLWDDSRRNPDGQIECAAERLKHWYSYASTLGSPLPTMEIYDIPPVIPSNMATYSLYKYTPWQSGNILHRSVYLRYWNFLKD